MSIPAYIRQRKGNGRQDVAIVKINGKRHHLGVYDSPESRQKYQALIAEYLRPSNRPEPADGPVTVNRLLVEFLKHAKTYYVDRDGKLSREHGHFVEVARLLREHAGREPAKDFGPKKLKAVRQSMIARDWARGHVNGQVRRLVAIFKWGVSEELVGVDVHAALKAVDGLRAGKTDAKEGQPREAVPIEDVLATVEHLPQVPADLVMVILHLGCRPTEAMIMRAIDLDTTGEIWKYRPQFHKTESTGDRVIAIGPKAQAIILRYLARDPEAYLFSPRDSEAKRLAAREAARTTPQSCGNRRGTNRVKAPRRTAGERYTKDSLGAAIRRARAKACVPAWTAYQLRHTALTAAREAGGLDAAQKIGGHRHASTTERYAKPSVEAVADVVKMLG